MFNMPPGFVTQAAALSYSAEVLADSPIAYYPMNEASGTTCTDASGNSRPATYSGSPTLGSAGLVTGGGTSCAYNGVSQYVNFTTNYTPILSLNRNFSIEWWMNLTDIASVYAIFSNGLPLTGNGGLFFRTTTSGGLEVLQSNTASLFTVTAGITAATTMQCVFSFDAANGWYFHRNGTLIASGTNTNTFGTAGHTQIGADSNIPRSSTVANYFRGRMGHLSIYGAKLSDARIAAHYAAGH